MLDAYMVLLLAGAFGSFYGFAVWCDRVVRETEG